MCAYITLKEKKNQPQKTFSGSVCPAGNGLFFAAGAQMASRGICENGPGPSEQD